MTLKIPHGVMDWSAVCVCGITCFVCHLAIASKDIPSLLLPKKNHYDFLCFLSPVMDFGATGAFYGFHKTLLPVKT